MSANLLTSPDWVVAGFYARSLAQTVSMFSFLGWLAIL
jgi:hypothetical protein